MPSVLEFTGTRNAEKVDGRSFLPLLEGRKAAWRDSFLYEYYWERNFPQTPTVHALRGDRFKYIRYHGIWDLDELYDLQADPMEMNNLINDPAHATTVANMNKRLFEILEQTGGMSMPLWPDRGRQSNKRHPDRSKAVPFPESFNGPR